MRQALYLIALLLPVCLAGALFPGQPGPARAAEPEITVYCPVVVYAVQGDENDLSQIKVTASCPDMNWKLTQTTDEYGTTTFDTPCCPAGRQSQNCMASARYQGIKKSTNFTVSTSCRSRQYRGIKFE